MLGEFPAGCAWTRSVRRQAGLAEFPGNREKTGRIPAFLPNLAAKNTFVSNRFRKSPHARRGQNNRGDNRGGNRGTIRAYQGKNRWAKRAKKSAPPPNPRALEESDDMAWAKPYVDEARADIARGDVITLYEHRARNAARLAALRD